MSRNPLLGAVDDLREGVAAFLKKRAPQFPLQVSRDLPELPDQKL